MDHEAFVIPAYFKKENVADAIMEFNKIFQLIYQHKVTFEDHTTTSRIKMGYGSVDYRSIDITPYCYPELIHVLNNLPIYTEEDNIPSILFSLQVTVALPQSDPMHDKVMHDKVMHEIYKKLVEKQLK